MESQELKYEYPFRIIDLKTNSFFVQEVDDDEIENFDAKKLEFGIRPSFGFDEKLIPHKKRGRGVTSTNRVCLCL